MKLNINAKELLALHNALYERFEGSDRKGTHFADEDPRSTDDAQLRQVYGRLKACIVGALTGRGLDPVDAWAAKEQAKIDKLSEELNDVKQEQTELAKLAPENLDVDQDDDFAYLEYPRKGRGPNRGGGRKR
jgi:hypothetical protein